MTDLSKVLNVGDKIFIYEDINIEYNSLVQDFADEETLIVSAPLNSGKIVLIQQDVDMDVFFYKDDGQYSFKAKVLENYKSGQIALIKIQLVSNINKLQRRNYYRLKIILPMSFSIKEEDKQDVEIYSGYTVNISGGGVKFVSPIKLKKGLELSLNIGLDDSNVTLRGRVLKCYMESMTKHIVRVSFNKVTEVTRDKIIKYIFMKQRSMRKKGFL